MRNLVTIAGFIVVALLLYAIWGTLNSRLIAVESSTGSYLYGEDGTDGGTGADTVDMAAVFDRIAQLEDAQAENAAAIAALLERVEQLEARPGGRVGRVIAREIVYFDFNDDRLSTAEKDKIDALLNSIDDNAFVSLIGHADTSGDNRYNQLLSLRRAAAVKNYIDARLRANGESDKLLLSITGTGEESVVNATGDDTRDRSNRIVEILVFR
jgi:outer membrane protein OmpA-like peptidoglycan-associated protein